jgi:hypothetical protein
VTETLAPPPAEAPAAPQPEPLTEIAAPAAPQPPRRREQGVPWFMILVFSPLLLYAIVITVFAVLIYRHEQELEQQFRNSFEKMPDVGDNPGVQRRRRQRRRGRDPNNRRQWVEKPPGFDPPTESTPA